MANRWHQAWSEIDSSLKSEAKTPVGKAAKAAGRAGRKLMQPMKFGFEINDYNESAMRLTLMLDRIAKGDTVEAATDMVKAVHFDYDDLTPIERTLFKRAISFYTFASKNLPLHLKMRYGGAHRKFKPLNAMVNNWQKPEDERVTQYMEEYFKNDIPLRISESTNKDGEKEYSYFLLGRWISDTDLDDIESAEKWDALASMSMSGLVRPIAESLMNKRIRKVSDVFNETLPKERIAKYNGQTTSFLGLRVNTRLAHSLNQIRALREINPINPGNIFGRGADTFSDKDDKGERSIFNESTFGRRPELSVRDRAMLYFSGRSLYTINPETRKMMRVSRNQARALMSPAQADYLWEVNDMIDDPNKWRTNQLKLSKSQITEYQRDKIKRSLQFRMDKTLDKNKDIEILGEVREGLNNLY